MIKVILLQDVDGLGKKYEVKSVKPGYARNFLFTKTLAKPATKEALAWLESYKEIESQKDEQELKNAQSLASNLDSLELPMGVKVGEEGQLFESVNSQKIADKLKEMGFEIKKSQIDLASPIKELGEFPVKIKLDHNLESEIRVVISEEKA